MTNRAASITDLQRWSESLAAIARTGLGFSPSIFERERFQEILTIAADISFAADEHIDIDVIDPTPAAMRVEEWLRDVGTGVDGYKTPRVSVGAIVGNDVGELLLVQRADSGVWLYPTGWADVGYAAAEVAVKEVREETGILVEPERLIMVIDGMQIGISRAPLYSLVFQCRMIGGELEAHPLECSGVGWFAKDALPEPIARADRWMEQAFRAIAGENVGVLFDRPREPTWRSG